MSSESMNDNNTIVIDNESIKKFNPEDLREKAEHFSMLISAKRRTGKSVLCHDFLYRMKDWGYKKVILISESAGAGQEAYKPIDPRLIHCALSDELLKEIWKQQEIDTAKDPKHKILVILDDVIGNIKKVRSSAMLGKFATLGRHNKISYIAICQYFKSFPKVFRDNSDLIVFFITTCEEDRKEILTRFCSVKSGYEAKELAHKVFQGITSEPYRTLIIKNYLSQVKELSDVMFWYKAEPLEKLPRFLLYKDPNEEVLVSRKVLNNGINFKVKKTAKKDNVRIPYL